jgi:hypothetical protein
MQSVSCIRNPTKIIIIKNSPDEGWCCWRLEIKCSGSDGHASHKLGTCASLPLAFLRMTKTRVMEVFSWQPIYFITK